jgi:HSP20 family protein
MDMRLVRWKPGTGLPVNHDYFEKMFDDFFGMDRRRMDLQNFDWTPRVNVEELEDKFEITAEVPGMKKDEIDIEVRDNILTIKGERKFEKEEKEANYHICERSYGTFQRAFTLPENVKTDDIEAEYKDGVLRLGIPKIEPEKPKEIKVEVK